MPQVKNDFRQFRNKYKHLYNYSHIVSNSGSYIQ